jgi:nitrate/nitrite-specific signal transduction histidine kinase
MIKDSAQAKLKALQDFLSDLERLPLAQESRAMLVTTRRQLEEICRELNGGQDQRRLSALYHVLQVLGTSLDLEAVITQVMDAAIGLTGAERGFLVLLEAEKKDWQFRAGRNFSLETLQSKDMEISRTVIDTVLESGSGLVTTDAQSDPRFSRHESVFLYSLR